MFIRKGNRLIGISFRKVVQAPCPTANLRTKIFWISEDLTQAYYLDFKGWNAHVHREFPPEVLSQRIFMIGTLLVGRLGVQTLRDHLSGCLVSLGQTLVHRVALGSRTEKEKGAEWIG